jgi:hypothetical protein
MRSEVDRMNAPWKLICIVMALVLFFLGIFIGPPPAPAPSWRSWNLISAGLFFYMLSIII